jgi:hypothetical protein
MLITPIKVKKELRVTSSYYTCVLPSCMVFFEVFLIHNHKPAHFVAAV